MKLSEDIKPITYIKRNSAELINTVNETHRPVIITQNGIAKAVVQDIESFEKQNKIVMLLKILLIEKRNIDHQNYIKQVKVFRKLEKKLNINQL